MPKPNRNGRTSKNKDRAARHASQQPSSQPTSQPPSQPASEQSSRQHSQQPSPLPTPSTGQRQLPTPLPEVDLRPHGGHSVMAHEYQHGVEDEYRHGLQHDEYTANLHHPPAAHSSSSSSETPPPESPPTISVDEGHGGGGGMLPPLSSSPGVDALIDFGVSPGTVGTTQDATATTVHAKGYGYAGGEGYGAHDIVDFGDDVAGMGLGLALEGTAYSGGSYEHQHDHRTTPCEHDNRNIAYGDDHDAEDEAYKSKSPPFRQAAELPDLEEDEEGLGGVAMGGGEGRGGGETSLSPLPTRPRLLDDDDYREGGEGEREERGYGELGYGYGHTREPVIPSRTLSHTSSRSSRSPPPVGSRSSNPSSGTPVSTTASSTRGSTSQAERTRSPSVPSTRSPSAPRTRSPIPAAVSATRSKSPISPSSLTRTIRSLAPGVVGSFAGKEERTYNREERRRGDERASLEGRKRREEDYADPEDRKVDRGGGYGGVDRGEGYDDGEGEYEYHPFSYGSPPVRQSGLPPRTIVPERQKSWKETETAQRRRKASPSPHSHSHRERERGRERGYDYDEEEEEDAYDERGEERTRREARGTGRERGLGRERERERNDTLKAASATSGLSQTLRQERRNLDDDAYSIAAANAPTAAREVNTFTSGRDINASTTTAARDRDDARRRVGRSSAGGSSGGGADTVLWAKWDKSGVGVGGRRRRLADMSFVPRCSYRLLLILAYANGLQIWDTSNLGSVKEVLNVNFEPETLARLGFVDEEAHESEKEVRAVDAQIVPTPLGKTKKDVWEGERPLLGILLNSTDREGETSTTFALYSLKNHRVVEKTGLVGVGERVECSSAGFVAVSTTSPPSIHILSSTSLETLYTVPSSSLALFAHPPAGHRTSTYLPSTSNLAESILSATQTQPFATPGPVGRTTSATAQGAKKPVFSLSGRLLAFAVPSTTNEGVGDKRRGVGGGDVGGGGGGSGGVGGEGRGGGSPSSVGSGTGFSFGLSNLSNISEIGKNVSELGRNVVQGRIPTSQAELGSAALKVGGSVLSGMRFLGGKAVEAVAKRSVSGGGGFGGGDASPAGSSPVMTSRGVGPGAGGVGAGGVGMGGVGGGRVSRSAPTDLGFGEGLGGQSEEKARRRLSGLSSVSPDSNGFGGGVSPLTKGRVERGSVVRVVDLGTLVDVNGNAKKELAAAKSSTTARTSAANKTSPTTTNKSSTTTKAPSTTKTPKVVVTLSDGQVTKVFKVVPGPPVPSGLRGARVGEEGVQSSTSPGRAQYASQSPPHGQGSYQDRTQGAYQDRPLGTAIHLYDLRRGVSSAVIEDIEVLPDGLLAGVTTRNRTVHVFASNPFGGRTDVGAHLSGRVRDYVGGLNPPLKVQLSPIVRVRGSRLGNQDGTGDGPRDRTMGLCFRLRSMRVRGLYTSIPPPPLLRCPRPPQRRPIPRTTTSPLHAILDPMRITRIHSSSIRGEV
ncbi:hypothetical protein CC1G_08930 [Coprinopsis cinerea okayama7|uniref:Uncharacterized protein n=1 Tax=Coprinopsis cinerea (strain Okayama-7 / 130 / ATCC MYA-4618 / FGSC 9003) TaxID=240176 RepID=A8P8D6_COPC7|nr:hypothetical protein CC1G_08930 [Coprinopsis cinerea okayama7\|eukprot:XP_001839551.2 hypothetical protein CC1G_08930 [Coprinopsis cinerea okayama7\